MDKIVIIGGSGFLGSHVADSLTNQGYDVFIFDKNFSKWSNPRQHMILGDILDKKELNKVISNSKYVFNFAGIADLNFALDKPIESAEINIIGNLNIMESCQKNNVKRYICASTVYVNGNEGGFYRCSKISCEKYIEEYKKTFDLNYTILRYGSLYGPRAGDNNGIFKLIYRAIKENKLVYEGHEDTSRDYIHVLDAAEASVTALRDEFKNQTLTITGQQTIKVIDLLKTICEILNLPEDKAIIIKKKIVGHYIRTPYSQEYKFTKKIVPSKYIDLSEGIVEIIKHLRKTNNL